MTNEAFIVWGDSNIRTQVSLNNMAALFEMRCKIRDDDSLV